jgi:hypothetical protein
MPEEIVHPNDISKEMLQSVYENAYMETSFDADGDLKVKETYSAYILPQADGKRIRLMCQFRTNPKSSAQDRINFANKINDKLILIRAYVLENGIVGFDYYIVVEGGTTKRNIIMTTKLFHTLLDGAIQQDEKNVLA